MYSKIFILVLAIIAFANGSEDDVLDLTDDDFNTRIGETETVLVMFYAPW